MDDAGAEAPVFAGYGNTWLLLSELVIALCYFSIPLQLVIVLKEVPIASLLLHVRLCFVMFILSCGMTHLLSFVYQFSDVYSLLVLSKVATAIVSVWTVVVLLKFNGELRKMFEYAATLESDVLASNERVAQMAARNEELQRLKTFAEDLGRTRQEFMATVSHEMRTPLQSIIGFGEVLLDSELDASQRSMVKTLLSSGRLLCRIINDVLDFSKFNKHSFQLEQKPFDLREVVVSALAPLQSNCQERGVKLLARFDEGVPKIFKGDSLRFVQVMTNLVGNSIKFSKNSTTRVRMSTFDSGEEVEEWKHKFAQERNCYSPEWSELNADPAAALAKQIKIEQAEAGPGLSQTTPLLSAFDSARSTSPPHSSAYGTDTMSEPPVNMEYSTTVNIPEWGNGGASPEGSSARVVPGSERDFRDSVSSVSSTDKWMRITVSDEGVGIQPSSLKRIFVRFVQSDSSVSRKFGGTGLGLSIVLQLVHKMGGSIHVQSELGKGTTFHVIVPIDAAGSDDQDAEVDGAGSWFEPVLTLSMADKRDVRASYIVEHADKLAASSNAEGNGHTVCHVADAQPSTAKRGDLRILVADDNDVNLLVARRMLEMVGIKNLATVSDGDKAVDFCRDSDNVVDCIFMDLNMPTLDGKSASCVIRKMPARKGIFIMAFSAALSNHEELAELRNNDQGPFDGIIRKPCTRAGLESVLGLISQSKATGDRSFLRQTWDSSSNV